MKQIKKSSSLVVKIIKIFLISIASLILIITFLSVKNINNDAGKGLFGYKFFVVLSDSMKPEFQSGDIVVIKKIDANELKVGDIITFYTHKGNVVTHKIIDKTTIESKEAFITQGINVEQADEKPVYLDNVIGKYTFSLPKAGYIFYFLKSPTGYYSLIFTPLMILVIINGVSFINTFKKYKEKQKEELKEKLEDERKKTEMMKDELQQLKEKLNQIGNNG